MKTIKHALLRFGAVYVPVGVAKAAGRNDIKFNTLHVDCGGQVGITSFCKTCGVTLTTDDIVKGYEVAKGQFVSLSEEELEAMKPGSSTMIRLDKFVDTLEIDPVFVEKMYYLTPNLSLHAPYELLSTTLAETSTVGIGKTTLWGKEHPVAIDTDAGVLTLKMLYCHDEVVSANEVRASLKFEADDEERELMKAWVEMKKGTIEVEDLSNVSRDHAHDIIQAKIDGKEIHAVDKVPEPKVTTHMLDVLREMVGQS